MKALKADAAEASLVALLDALASILIPLDITPGRLSQIARASFVKTSLNRARKLTSGRPHLARIAALTGLSRTEVKRIVSSNFEIGKQEPETSPRALRVLKAWQVSKRYSKSGRALPLRLHGPFPSFETLCREFSGDIPYKVILSELEGRGSLGFRDRKRWVSLSKSSKQHPAKGDAVSNLSFAASLIEQLSRGSAVLVKRKDTVGAPHNVDRLYVEKAVAGRITNGLEDLPQLFISRRRSRKNKACVEIYTLVSRSGPSKNLRS
jgi:hypothetical protein